MVTITYETQITVATRLCATVFLILSDQKALGNASQNTLLSPDSSHVAKSCHFPVEQCSTGTHPLNIQSRSDIHTVFLFSVIKFCFQGH